MSDYSKQNPRIHDAEIHPSGDEHQNEKKFPSFNQRFKRT